MTTKGLHAISPVMKLKLLPIPNAIKQKTKAARIKALFLFLNKSRNLFSWDESFFLLFPSMKGIRRFSNHFFKAFMGFILNKGLHTFFSWSTSSDYYILNYQICNTSPPSNAVNDSLIAFICSAFSRSIYFDNNRSQVRISLPWSVIARVLSPFFSMVISFLSHIYVI